MYKVLISAVNQ